MNSPNYSNNNIDVSENTQIKPKLNNVDEVLQYALIYIGFNLIIYILKSLNEKFFSEKVKFF
jgi:hypothetical protein